MPQSYIDRLYENNVKTLRVTEAEGFMLRNRAHATGIIGDKAYIKIDGSQTAKAAAVLAALEAAQASGRSEKGRI